MGVSGEIYFSKVRTISVGNKVDSGRIVEYAEQSVLRRHGKAQIAGEAVSWGAKRQSEKPVQTDGNFEALNMPGTSGDCGNPKIQKGFQDVGVEPQNEYSTRWI